MESAKETAIVTDGLWRKSISAIRSLGKEHIAVTVMGDSILTTGMWSRFCYKKEKCATAASNPESFGKGLEKAIAHTTNKPVILPMEDATLMWCSENRKKLSKKSYLLLPPIESLRIAENKMETMKYAIKHKIHCPKTFFPKTVKELKKILEKQELPDYVLKPYSGSGSAGILYWSEAQEVNLEEHWQRFGPLIVQERIPKEGEGYGISILMDQKSNVICYFGHRRLEQYPNSGGPSTQRIGFYQQQLIDESVRLLKSLHWSGVAMVEWKENPLTKEFVLMEINPRFWGSLELAVRSGVNFPYLYYQVAKGRKVNPVTNYSTTTVCRWLIPGDILRYLTKPKREKLSTFLKHCLKESEEWDKQDKRTFFASIICQGCLVFNPKYWKYIRK